MFKRPFRDVYLPAVIALFPNFVFSSICHSQTPQFPLDPKSQTDCLLTRHLFLGMLFQKNLANLLPTNSRRSIKLSPLCDLSTSQSHSKLETLSTSHFPLSLFHAFAVPLVLWTWLPDCHLTLIFVVSTITITYRLYSS
jgi:hypothetical protein